MQKLKEKIIKESSALVNALKKKDDFEAICQIREWVYKRSNIAPKQLQTTMQNMGKMQTIDADEATVLYERKMLGSTCGGANIYLAKVYKIFNYQATTYNFGLEGGGLTHEICVVKPNNKNVLLLQDAFFNGYFACGGLPINFLEVEEIFEKKRPISFVKGKNRTKCRLLDRCITPRGEEFYCCTEVEFSWENAIGWFEKMNQKHHLDNFYDLMKYPLNYNAIGVSSEENLLVYLDHLSVQNGTRYHEIKKKKLLNFGTTNTINIHLPEAVNEKKRLALYGIGGYGLSVYNSLEKEGLKVHGIIDANKELLGVKLGARYISGPEQLKEIDCDVIIVCSISHKADIVANIYNIIGTDVEIVTLDQMLEASDYL